MYRANALSWVQIPRSPPYDAVRDCHMDIMDSLFLLPKSRNICWRCGEGKEFLSMKRMTAGDLQALELLMQTTPGFEHFDSGADGILPECRSCRFHRPHWKYQSCVFAECPYCCNPVSTLKNQSGTSAAGKEVSHG